MTQTLRASVPPLPLPPKRDKICMAFFKSSSGSHKVSLLLLFEIVKSPIHGGRVSEPARAAVTKYDRLGGLNNRNLFSPKFWRLEFQDQAAGKFGSWWGLSFWFRDGHFLALSSRGLPPVHAEKKFSDVSSSSHKDTCPIGSEPHPYDLIWPSLSPYRS